VIAAPGVTSHADWPPDYTSVFLWRQQALAEYASKPHTLIWAKAYYAENPVDFICHWCTTYDPRNALGEMPASLPLVLFERQAELIEFFMTCLEAEQSGLVEKARDMGATWLACGFSVWLWLFRPGASVGWGSRKEALVDKLGDVDSIFEKIRVIVRNLPRCFWPRGFSEADHMPHMRILNPENGATITGESGDNIGRGGRKLIYFKDESAHYERPELIEASLSENTRVQIDISSVNGLGNVFHRKREAGTEWRPGNLPVRGRTNVFVMDWSDHPAKTPEWYAERRAKFEADGLMHVFAQEIDRNYAAAVDNVVIEAEWIRAAIDAHIKLGFDDSGGWVAGLDLADGGGDTNALAARKGVVLRHTEEWGARDPGVTARRAIDYCAKLAGGCELQYDSVGIGSNVKSEINRLADEGLIPAGLYFGAWSAGSSPLRPDERVIPDDENSKTNRDFYANLKAQGWWSLRQRFYRTWQAVEQGVVHDPENLISLDSTLPQLRQIQKELAQVTFGQSATLKLLINKKPEGTKSPNVADAIVEAFCPVPSEAPITVPAEALAMSVLATGYRARRSYGYGRRL
jgi:phage terminase large subunit